MNDPHNDTVSWDGLTWQDIQAIGRTLAKGHANANILTLTPEGVTELVAQLPGFHAGGTRPDEFTLSAIITAWIAASEGDDDSSPYEYLA
jgi:FeS assembly protein IscX